MLVVAHTEGGDPIVVDQKLFDAGATWAPHARIERIAAEPTEDE